MHKQVGYIYDNKKSTIDSYEEEKGQAEQNWETMLSCTSIPYALRRNRNGVKPHKLPVIAMAYITKMSLIKDLIGKKSMMILTMTNVNKTCSY